MAGVVRHPELARDQGRHPLEGPELGAVARRQGTLKEELHQSLFLPWGEPGRAPGGRLGPQLFQASLPVGLPPAEDRTHRGTQCSGDRRQGLASL
jgi:hypothetical protein